MVKYESADSVLWTLAMIGLDSSLVEEGEVLHWQVGTISGNDLATVSVSAFPPFW